MKIFDQKRMNWAQLTKTYHYPSSVSVTSYQLDLFWFVPQPGPLEYGRDLVTVKLPITGVSANWDRSIDRPVVRLVQIKD